MRGAALLLAGVAAAALAAPARSPVQWHPKQPMAHPLKRGAKFDATVVGEIEPGWHVYALEEPDGGPIATTLNLTEGDVADVQRVSEAKPTMLPDPVFGKPTGFFVARAEFTVHGTIARDAPPGAQVLHVLVRFQCCSDRVCLPPHTETVGVPITVAP